MREQIEVNLDKMVVALNKGFDIIIKKNKEGIIKIAYFKPRNISTIVE